MFFLFGENEQCELMCKQRRKLPAVFQTFHSLGILTQSAKVKKKMLHKTLQNYE